MPAVTAICVLASPPRARWTSWRMPWQILLSAIPRRDGAGNFCGRYRSDRRIRAASCCGRRRRILAQPRRQPLPSAVVLNLDEGAVLKIRAGRSGSWCYLAVAAVSSYQSAWLARHPHPPGFGGVGAARIVAGDRLGIDPSGSSAPSPSAIVASWLDRPSTPYVLCLALNTTTSPTTRYQRFWPGPGLSPQGRSHGVFSRRPSA